MEGPTDSHMQQHTRIQGSYPSRVQLPKSTQEIPLPSEILADAISENKGKLSDLETFTKHSFLLHIIDSGGQPEFMEVLPALVTGPVINLLVFPLNHSLHERYTAKYVSSEGKSSESYISELTTEETLLQSLSIVSCRTSAYSSSSQGVTLFVGTHRDLVTDEEVRTADSELRQMVTYKCSTLCNPHLNRLVFAVDNMQTQDSEVSKLRAVVNGFISKNLHPTDVTAAWLLFDYALRSTGVKVITFQQCLEFGRAYGISTQKEMKRVLWYFHHTVGTLRYYGEVKELEDVVICDPKILSDSVMRLTTSTFTFKNPKVRTHHMFKTNGRFPIEVLESILDTEKQALPPKVVIEVLKHLHIIAPITDEQEAVTSYFMPCVLGTFPVETLPPDASSLPPLLISFECGYCPIGLFCALLAYLTSHNPKRDMKWQLAKRSIYRNKAVFHVGRDNDEVSLINHPKYYEIRLERHQGIIDPTPLHSVCYNITATIVGGISAIKASLNYSMNAQHSMAFFCSRQDCCSPPHLAVCDGNFDNKPNPNIMMCSLSSKPMSVTQSHLLWYGQVSPINVTSCS